MTAVNYQRELERVLDGIASSGHRPKLLLHACCAPCSSYCLEYLTRSFDIIVYYYNPNITPRREYDYRLDELRRLVQCLPHDGSIEVVPGLYEPQKFLEAARGLEMAPEGGERCRRCFQLRLSSAAEAAIQYDCEYFTTTLTISPLKDAQLLNAIGFSLAEESGVPWLPSDFKKRDGYRRSCALSREYGLYRQDYCGCVYSRMARDARLAAQ